MRRTVHAVLALLAATSLLAPAVGPVAADSGGEPPATVRERPPAPGVSPEIVAVVPNPATEGDRGERVLVRFPRPRTGPSTS